MTTDTILHKYMRHLRYIDQGNIVHLDAVELALRCALHDLADWLGSPTDHSSTDENLIAAQGRRITELQADLERLQQVIDSTPIHSHVTRPLARTLVRAAAAEISRLRAENARLMAQLNGDKPL